MFEDLPSVLLIAGTDSSGGAGLARDLQALAMYGIHGCCAVTAVTAQTNIAVVQQALMPADLIAAQIHAAFASRRITAIKTGMLGNASIIETVHRALLSHKNVPLIVDPVLCSSSGSRLLDVDGIAALLKLLVPRATLLTPNVMEAAALLQQSICSDEQQLIHQARQLLAFGPAAVLLKGGHTTDSIARDWLVSEERVHHLDAARLAVQQRGTGCALSTAIAAGLAQGNALLRSCHEAKHFLWRSLLNAANPNADPDAI